MFFLITNDGSLLIIFFIDLSFGKYVNKTVCVLLQFNKQNMVSVLEDALAISESIEGENITIFRVKLVRYTKKPRDSIMMIKTYKQCKKYCDCCYNATECDWQEITLPGINESFSHSIITRSVT